MSRTKVYLHVGTRKSGTSYLQLALRKSAPALAEQGVDLMFRTRQGNVDRQLTPLRRFVQTGDEAPARRAMEWTAERVRRNPGARHLITLEDLAELPPEAVALVMDGLADFDVELIVTARHWGLTIPSEWQQCVKERHTGTFRDFVIDVREGTGMSALFRSRQDVPAIVERWGERAAATTVIAVPPTSRTEGTLVEMFCDLVGVDPATLTVPGGVVNQSLSLAQAELLRRINIELGDRLPDPAGSYRHGMREWLARRSLMRHPGPSIRLPEEFLDWCREATAAQLEGIRASGARLVGRPDDLLAGPDLATGPDTVDDAAIAAVAVTTLADLGADRWREIQQRPATPVVDARPPAPRRPLARARARAAGLRRALRARAGGGA